jgi:hypothetical protein
MQKDELQQKYAELLSSAQLRFIEREGSKRSIM